MIAATGIVGETAMTLVAKLFDFIGGGRFTIIIRIAFGSS